MYNLLTIDECITIKSAKLKIETREPNGHTELIKRAWGTVVAVLVVQNHPVPHSAVAPLKGEQT